MQPKMTEEQQAAQDMITIAVNQRNSAQNESIQLGAQILGLNRKIEELEAKIKELEAKIKELEDAASSAPKKANGKHVSVSASSAQ